MINKINKKDINIKINKKQYGLFVLLSFIYQIISGLFLAINIKYQQTISQYFLFLLNTDKEFMNQNLYNLLSFFSSKLDILNLIVYILLLLFLYYSIEANKQFYKNFTFISKSINVFVPFVLIEITSIFVISNFFNGFLIIIGISLISLFLIYFILFIYLANYLKNKE